MIALIIRSLKCSSVVLWSALTWSHTNNTHSLRHRAAEQGRKPLPHRFILFLGQHPLRLLHKLSDDRGDVHKVRISGHRLILWRQLVQWCWVRWYNSWRGAIHEEDWTQSE